MTMKADNRLVSRNITLAPRVQSIGYAWLVRRDSLLYARRRSSTKRVLRRRPEVLLARRHSRLRRRSKNVHKRDGRKLGSAECELLRFVIDLRSESSGKIWERRLSREGKAKLSMAGWWLGVIRATAPVNSRNWKSSRAGLFSWGGRLISRRTALVLTIHRRRRRRRRLIRHWK